MLEVHMPQGVEVQVLSWAQNENAERRFFILCPEHASCLACERGLEGRSATARAGVTHKSRLRFMRDQTLLGTQIWYSHVMSADHYKEAWGEFHARIVSLRKNRAEIFARISKKFDNERLVSLRKKLNIHE
jgi:hypothetical protein